MVISGTEAETTNQRMELMAVLKALEALPSDFDDFLIYSDSAYVVNGCTDFIHSWAANGWKTSKGGQVANLDIWQRIYPLLSSRKARLVKVKGHSGDAGNEYVDSLASQVARG